MAQRFPRVSELVASSDGARDGMLHLWWRATSQRTLSISPGAPRCQPSVVLLERLPSEGVQDQGEAQGVGGRGRRGRESSLELDPRGTSSTILRRVLRKEDAAKVREEVGRLPDSQRHVIEQHWFQGLPLKQVAKNVGASLSAVKVRAHRGYKRLRLSLAATSPRPQAA